MTRILPDWFLAAAPACLALLFTACSHNVGVDAPDAGTDARIRTGPYDECGNGMDDDADGRIDEGCFCGGGETQPCFRGTYPNRGVGACADGVQRCDAMGSTEFGHWGACEMDTLPSDEACDGVDNDCDGATDEGCPCTEGQTQGCGSEFAIAPCRAGTQSCRADGTWSACEGAVGPSAETCGDGIDNDCDGLEDEGCACVPEPEVCDDGVDNDCDGVVDEPSCRSLPDGGVDAGGRTDGGDADGGDADGGVPPDGGLPCDPSFDPGTLHWQDPTTDGAPSSRQGESWVWTGSELFVWGGSDYDRTTFSDGALYNPRTDSWRPVASEGAPRSRTGALAVWTGSEVVVWGGYYWDGPISRALRDGGRYDVARGTWTSIPAGGPLSWTKAAWTGSELSVVVSATDLWFLDLEHLRWRTAALFPGSPDTVRKEALWTGSGWLFAGVYDYRVAGMPRDAAPVESPPWWYYDVATDSWHELPPKPYLDPEPVQGVSNQSIPVLMVPLDERRVAVLGEYRLTPDGYVNTRDDVFVLDLSAGSWTLTYRGEEQPELRGCVSCDVVPGRCSGCPDTSMYRDTKNSYGSGAPLGCGLLAMQGWSAERSRSGLPRFRWFASDLTSFVESPVPPHSWSSAAVRHNVRRTLGNPLGDYGFLMLHREIASGLPYQMTILAR